MNTKYDYERWPGTAANGSKIRYAVYPGSVFSKNDGQYHHIPYYRLIELYKIDPKLCFDASRPENMVGTAGMNIFNLEPRYDGDYDEQSNNQ